MMPLQGAGMFAGVIRSYTAYLTGSGSWFFHDAPSILH